mmetsp:Transcript_25945/g.22983  ORF Transcript_25945/g.22983 Transcript_25945/m.22983 type:complete len:243 (+) Transcript_25945:202-930(+)
MDAKFELIEEEQDFMSLISTVPKSVEGDNMQVYDAPFQTGTNQFNCKKSKFVLTQKENAGRSSHKSKVIEEDSPHIKLVANSKITAEKENIESNESQNYSVLVDSLLNLSRKTCISLPCRKDVVNKKILRAFKKRICNQFLLKEKRPCRALNSIKVLKDNLLKEATRIGLISSEETNDEELSELVCWMSMTKITKVTKSIFDYENKSISILDDILSKYSHVKLRTLSKNTKIAKIFAYFIKN